MNHASTHVATAGPIIFLILVVIALALIVALYRFVTRRWVERPGDPSRRRRWHWGRS